MQARLPDQPLVYSPDYYKLEVRIRPGETWVDNRTGRIYFNQSPRSIRFWLLTEKPSTHGESYAQERTG